MNREVSAYLECARLAGAVLVLLGHMQLNWTPGIGQVFVPLGNESVAILFVISGFVIGFVSSGRETTMRNYMIHRSARAYSILIPCVVFGLVLDFAGKHFMPHYYHAMSWPPLQSDGNEILASLFSLTFLGGAWGQDMFPGSMAPYWTFPLEWTYYLVFGAAWYLRGWGRLLMLAVVCAVAGPQAFIFFPLWLMGMISFRLHRGLKLSITAGRWIFFTALLVVLIVQTAIFYSGFQFGFGAQKAPDLWPFYLAGVGFCVLTIGFAYSGIKIGAYTGWARWLAGASGSLYLLHFPLARFINGAVPWTWHPILRESLMFLLVVGVTLVFAQYSERQKEVWRRHIEGVVDRVERLFRARALAVRKDA
jgi:peptidoglycan/LPS O-acetylase OafA/YrhL